MVKLLRLKVHRLKQTTVSSAGAAGISTGAETAAAVVSCQSGVFYVGGYFVFKEAESIILEKFVKYSIL